MNHELLRVYEERKMRFRWGLPPAGLSLDEIIIGDSDKRDQNREKYMAEKVNRHLEAVLKSS